MKAVLNLCLTVVLSLFVNVSLSQDSNLPIEKIIKLDSFENLYQSGEFYFAGQPSLEAFQYLKKQGVKTVINLRSVQENEDFSKKAFNEEHLMKELGIKYVSIPMEGKEAFSPVVLKQFSTEMLNAEAKVLIHCKAAGRVTLVMMAYLIKHHNYTLEQAEAFGEQITYFNYLNALLNKN